MEAPYYLTVYQSVSKSGTLQFAEAAIETVIEIHIGDLTAVLQGIEGGGMCPQTIDVTGIPAIPSGKTHLPVIPELPWRMSYSVCLSFTPQVFGYELAN